MNSALLAWHQSLATIFSSPVQSHSIDLLIKSLEQLVNGSNSMAILYPLGASPSVTHHRLLADEDPVIQIDRYVEVAYLLDPYYRSLHDLKMEGLFTLDDVAPDGFKESEYYNVYFKQSNLIDEASFLFQLNDKTLASISIGRSISSNQVKFSKSDIDLLAAIFPIVKCIMRLWLDNDADITTTSIVSHLDNALTNFGSSLLTDKECQILHLILHGNSIKGIANKLDNSLETIKHHRKNIYAKLDVSSQAELFHLFIDSLRNAPEHCTGDPLSYYC